MRSAEQKKTVNKGKTLKLKPQPKPEIKPSSTIDDDKKEKIGSSTKRLKSKSPSQKSRVTSPKPNANLVTRPTPIKNKVGVTSERAKASEKVLMKGWKTAK